MWAMEGRQTILAERRRLGCSWVLAVGEMDAMGDGECGRGDKRVRMCEGLWLGRRCCMRSFWTVGIF